MRQPILDYDLVGLRVGNGDACRDLAFACGLAWSEAAAFDDAEFCTYAQEMARQINEGSPDKISEGLTLDGALVTCASKLFEFRKRADTVLQLGWRKIRK